MSIEEIGILLVASICHDLDHPGYNNTYVYSKILLQGTHRDHENMVLMTGVPYKRIPNYFLSKIGK